MHISYKPLWHTLLERDMRKEDLRLAAGMTTNMIANMSKEITDTIADVLADYSVRPARMLEPSAGVGVFVDSMLRQQRHGKPEL